MNIKCPFCGCPTIFAGMEIRDDRTIEFYHCNHCGRDFIRKKGEKNLILIKIS